MRIRCALALLIMALPLAPYGKNKVNYDFYKWNILKSPHFDIYHDAAGETVAREAAKILEDGVSKYRTLFDHNLEKIIPVVIYCSTDDFEGTHIYPGLIPEGVGGFTEPLRTRVVVPFTGSYHAFRHVVLHELAHAYQFDVLYGDAAPIFRGFLQQPPLWLMEGMAEYASRDDDNEMHMYVRDGLLSAHMPTIDKLNDPYELGPYGYFVYKGGEAFYRYVEKRFGREYVANLLHTLRAAYDLNAVFNFVFGKNTRDINDDWHFDAKRTYLPDVVHYEPLAPAAKRVTDHFKDRSSFNFHPLLSPDGKEIYLLCNRNVYPSIISVNAESSEQMRTVAVGERSDEYEHLHILDNTFSFTSDGSLFVFTAKAGPGDRIVLYNTATQWVEKRIALPFSSVQFARISPLGGEIVFTGVSNGMADIYIYDRSKGGLERITFDRYYESRPCFSHDGSKIVFSVNSNAACDYYSADNDIVVYDRASRTLHTVVASDGDDRIGDISLDGTKIIFSSDVTGVSDLYIKDISSGSIKRVTKTFGGAFEPRFSKTGDRIVFSGYEKGGYDIYIADVDTKAAYSNVSTVLFRENVLGTAYRTKDLVIPSISSAYAPWLMPDYFVFAAGYSSYMGGGLDLFTSFADMLNEQRVNAYVQLLYDDVYKEFTANADLTYWLIPFRIDLGVNLYHYKETYYAYDTNEATGVRRLYSDDAIGGGALVRFPFDKFTRFDLFINPELHFITYPGAGSVSNHMANVYLAELSFVYDTSIGDMLSARDNSMFLITIQRSLKLSDNDYGFTLIFGDLRQYLMLLPNMNFAFRIAGGKIFDVDRFKRPFRLGGITRMFEGLYADYVTTVRAYGHGEFTGENVALINLEFRFPFIDYIKFGLPIGLGNIEGVLFSDFGMAWSDEHGANLGYWDGGGLHLTDLKSAMGVGFRFVVPPFLYFRFDFAWKFVGNGFEGSDKSWLPFFWFGMKLYDF
ncbi:MAG: basic secretory protein-like protein [Spirochaetota bacterium]